MKTTKNPDAPSREEMWYQSTHKAATTPPASSATAPANSATSSDEIQDMRHAGVRAAQRARPVLST
ncbi:hypothetical protein TBR22_A30210 [Luteitalea sp. TBR-22]|nr:hypothetical protein TBR22_A30210 [Luteitalea sp. TBR-22]